MNERHDWHSAGAVLAAPLAADLTALAMLGLAASARVHACHDARIWGLVDRLGIFGWLSRGDTPNPGSEEAMRAAREAWNAHVAHLPFADLHLWELPSEPVSATDLLAWPASRGAMVLKEAARRIAGQAEGSGRLLSERRIQRLDELADAAEDASRALARQARLGWDSLTDPEKRFTGGSVIGLNDTLREAGLLVLALPSPAPGAVRA